MRETSNRVDMIARLGAIALSLVCVAPTLARAQGTPYTFTRIADTLRNDAGLAGVYCVGMSGLGTVIVVFAPAGSSLYQLWRGDGQSFTQVDTSLASTCASINDSDETAYLTPLSPGSSLVRLVKNSMGTLTTLARSDVTPFLYGPTTHLPSLSNSGSAVFMTAQGGIAVGPAGPIVYDPSIGPPLTLISPVSMNDSQTVAFLALAAGKAGIYRGSAVPLSRDRERGCRWNGWNFPCSARHQQFRDSRVCRKCWWDRSARLHDVGRCVSHPRRYESD